MTTTEDAKNDQATVKRPPRTTLEGMIWNANQVLEWALDPKANGIPRSFFESAVGLVIISVVEVGFIFSGNVGSGILFKKQPKPDGSIGTFSNWSAPSAMGLSGLGFGYLVGASEKDLIVFIMDEPTLDATCTSHGFKLGVQGELTLGPLGRTYKADVGASKEGLGSTISIAYTKGLFAGVNVSGAILGVRDKVNEKFYNTPKITVKDILNTPREEMLQKVTSQVHLLDDVYEKLQQIEEEMIDRSKLEYEFQMRKAEKMAKKQEAAKAAEAAHEEYVATVPDHDVVEVDVAASTATHDVVEVELAAATAAQKL